MGLPFELQRFVAAHLDSIGGLEMLIALLGTTEPQPESVLAQRLGVPAEHARTLLRGLVASGAVEEPEPGCYRLRPEPDPTRRLVAELAHEYSVHRIDVINAVYSSGLERLRAFADAFRLKGPPS